MVSVLVSIRVRIGLCLLGLLWVCSSRVVVLSRFSSNSVVLWLLKLGMNVIMVISVVR